MKWTLTSLLSALAAFSISAATLDLAGDGWRLDGRWGTGNGEREKISLPISVPCDVQTALFDAGKLIDPNWGDNEMKAQWPGEHDWTYSREFDVPADILENDSIILRLEDCDTFCTVAMNGEVVGVTSNRFMRYDFDVKPYLKPGRNTLSGFFKSPEVVAEELKKLYPDIPYGVANVKPNLTEGMALIRKPACHGGWDWGLAQMVVGFCGKVELIGAKAARIDYVYCDQTIDPSFAKVTVNVEVFAPKAGHVPFNVTFGEESRTETRELAVGANKVSFDFTVDNPRLWWPVGEGEQNLYQLSVKTQDGGLAKKIGLRSARLVNEKYIDDQSGEERLSFAFEVNGRRIFAKGVNWIPCDAFDARQEAKYRPLLEAARNCNMNMIRVWGGGQFERDSFYALCDELGLMVFHDFMFGCSRNTVDPWFMSLVEAETRHQVKRLRDVPSIVLWAGDNECIGTALGCHVPIRTDKKERARRIAHYVDCWKKRTAMQAKWVAELDPARSFWRSSPCDGFDDPCAVYNTPRHGDWHTYDEYATWHECRPNFCAEFGFQSYPSKEVALTFVKPEDIDPVRPLFAYHQKSEYGSGMLLSAIEKFFKHPEGGLSGEDQIFVSLVNQARLVRRATEAWRTQMPRSMGALIWQLNDNWPVASWSMVEFGGKWKPLMYEARRFFAPVAAFATSPKKGVVTLTAINDLPKTVDAKVTLRLMTFGGETLKAETLSTTLQPRTATLLKSCAESDFGNEGERRNRFLVVDIETGDKGIATYQTGWLFDTFKNLNLAEAKVQLAAAERGGAFAITLSTDKPAFSVWVEAFGIPGEFSDNHFTLLPGEPRTLTFKPRDPKTTFDDFRKSLTVKHIRETY